MQNGVLPDVVIADANVLLAALVRGRACVILIHPHGPRVLATEAARQDVMEHAPLLARKRGLDLGDVQAAIAAMPVEWQGADAYSRFREQALERIGHRDPDDWPTVALALAADVPIWSQDKDLEESGLRIYTAGQLLDSLPRETDGVPEG